MLYLLLKNVLRYRKSIIEKNIKLSFPDATKQELNQIKDNYYKHLIQLVLALQKDGYFDKAITYSRELIDVITEEGIMNSELSNTSYIELLENIVSQGQNISTVSGHFANWEWLSSTPLWSNKTQFASLFKRINNPILNKLSINIRSRFGLHCIDKNNALRKIIELSKKPEGYVVAFIADQCPSRKNIHYWIKFLNQATPIFSGWATISRKLNNAIVYIKVTQISNHRYKVRFDLLTTTPKKYTDKELCEMYMNRLEEDIKETPELWLWSHNRWKHEPPKDLSL